MACLLNVLAATLVVGSSVRGNGAVVKGVDNAEQFALLCRVYNVARNPPINHADLQDPLKIVNEIDALNASLADEKRFSEIEKVENSRRLSEDPNETIPASQTQGDAGNKAATTVSSGKEYTKLNPRTMREAALAQASLKQITQKAHKILEKIRKVNITEEVEKADAEFAQVIFGKGGSEGDLCNGALSGVGGREAACGSSGLVTIGNSAGKNLVVDFFCLCAQNTDGDGINDACGVKVGGTGKNSDKYGWGTTAPLGSSAMWAFVKKGCGNLLHQHPKSTEEGRDVLGDFLKHLKSGGVYRWGDKDDGGRKEGMLGTSAGEKGVDGKGAACDGTKGNNKKPPKSGSPSPGGICVYYGPSNWEENILWLKQFKAALDTVDALNRKTASFQRALEKLQMLHHRAEQIYETTKVILELENLEGPAVVQNVSGSFTAYNGTRTRSYSHNPHPYFALPWALLL